MKPVTLICKKTRAALAVRGISVEHLAKLSRLSYCHVAMVIRGRYRCPPPLEAVMRAALGPSGWAFATGESDMLRDDGQAGDGAPHAPA